MQASARHGSSRELWERLPEQRPEPLRRTGRCLSYGTGTAYWALGEVLREHLGLLESDAPEVALDRLGAREILGLTLGLDVAHDLHPLAARDRFQDAWAEFLTDLVAERPAVLLIEDVHWAETQLLDLLEYVLGSAEGPLLVIVTARPELLQRRPGWGARAGGELLELEPLSAQDCVRMLDEMLAGGLPDRAGGAGCRAGRGQSLLRRGAARRADRSRPACPPERRLGAARASKRVRCAGLRAGRSRGPDRSARRRGEVRASGGGGDRARLLDWAGLRARRGEARSARARGSRPRSSSRGLEHGRRARVRDQARPDTRSGVRESPPSPAPADARRVRGLARAPGARPR